MPALTHKEALALATHAIDLESTRKHLFDKERRWLRMSLDDQRQALMQLHAQLVYELADALVKRDALRQERIKANRERVNAHIDRLERDNAAKDATITAYILALSEYPKRHPKMRGALKICADIQELVRAVRNGKIVLTESQP
jgi:hypothetical protein